MPVAYIIRLAIIGFMAWQGTKSGDTDLTKWNAAYLTGISAQVAQIQKALGQP